MLKIRVSDAHIIYFQVVLTFELQDLFKRGSALEGMEKDLERGGVGVRIVRQLVESNGGMVWAESEIGRGTTFFVTLPIFEFANEKSAAPPGPLPVQSVTPRGPKRVVSGQVTRVSSISKHSLFGASLSM